MCNSSDYIDLCASYGAYIISYTPDPGVVGILRLVMNITKKPWNSRAFGNSRAAFAQHFLDTFPPESREFQEIAPDVASDLCLPADTPVEQLHQTLGTFKALFTEQNDPRLNLYSAVSM